MPAHFLLYYKLLDAIGLALILAMKLILYCANVLQSHVWLVA